MPLTPITAGKPTSAAPTRCLGRRLMQVCEGGFCGLQKPRWLQWRRKGRSYKSCDDDSFVVLDVPGHSHFPVQASQSFDSTMSHATHSRRQQNQGLTSDDSGRASSVASSLTSRPPRTDKPTFQWIVQRKSFIDPIFNHQSKTFNKKFTVAGGSREGECTLTFALKLYPNGVNWDQDTSASLQVEIGDPRSSSPSHPPSSPRHASCTAYVEVMLVELVGKAEQKLLSYRRQVCRLWEKKGFILNHFIPHDVIKTSSAESFRLLFNVTVSYSLGEDWVWVGAEDNLGCMVEL